MSEWEELLAIQIRASKLTAPVREYLFMSGRKFRADFAWPDQKLIAECDGGTWAKGGHSSGKGIERDYERDCLAVIGGWRVLRFTSGMIRRGDALRMIERALCTA